MKSVLGRVVGRAREVAEELLGADALGVVDAVGLEATRDDDERLA